MILDRREGRHVDVCGISTTDGERSKPLHQSRLVAAMPPNHRRAASEDLRLGELVVEQGSAILHRSGRSVVLAMRSSRGVMPADGEEGFLPVERRHRQSSEGRLGGRTAVASVSQLSHRA